VTVGSSFDLPDPDRFTAGTVGPPGQRVFYLQAGEGAQVVSLRLEKAQVAALAEYLASVLADLPTPEPESLPEDLDLVEPVVPEWVVGQIGVVFDEDRDRMLVQAEELVEEEAEGDVEPLEVEKGIARVALTRAQVAAFVGRAAELVAAGRPPCPLCGRPMDPAGHACIKTNGHRAR
jgi:uncharacterized repeat protein (TIGR03847 family)